MAKGYYGWLFIRRCGKEVLCRQCSDVVEVGTPYWSRTIRTKSKKYVSVKYHLGCFDTFALSTLKKREAVEHPKGGRPPLDLPPQEATERRRILQYISRYTLRLRLAHKRFDEARATEFRQKLYEYMVKAEEANVPFKPFWLMPKYGDGKDWWFYWSPRYGMRTPFMEALQSHMTPASQVLRCAL